VKHSRNLSEINDLVFNRVNSYFLEVSYGIISLKGNTTGWYSLNRTMAEYGRDSQFEIDDPNGDGRCDHLMLIRDAVSACDKDVNFTLYNHVLIVHAGNGQESSNSTDDLWSAYSSDIYVTTNDGVVVSRACVVPETEAFGADTLGVYAHEFGHSLGLPDLYSSDYKHEYVGRWCLMAWGNTNGYPICSSPAHPISWCKIKLGWISPASIAIVHDGNCMNVTIDPLESPTSGYHAVKLPLMGNEYYLVEVRQRIGFDTYLPSSGVLISYVDEDLRVGIVKVKDADPSTSTLNDAAWQVGQVFQDKANEITVSILSTNGSSFLVNVDRRGPMPDLTITNVYLTPSNPHVGDNVTFYAEIKNQGTADADSFYVHCYLNGTLRGSERFSLGVGGSITVRYSWKATLGVYVLKFVVDPSNVILELVESNNEMTKIFTVGYYLTVQTPYSGVWVKIDGARYDVDLSGKVQVSVLTGAHTIEVQTPVALNRGSQAVFKQWSDGNFSNPRTVNVGGDLTLTVSYKVQYRLTVNANGGAATGEGWYDSGSTATATAISPFEAVPGKTRLIFIGWSGDSTSTSVSIAILMNTSHTVVANWKTQHYVNVSSPYGGVQGGGWCDLDSTAAFSVKSPIDHGNGTRRVFIKWTGDYTGTLPNGSILVNGPKTIQANWQTQHRVSFTHSGLPNGVAITLTVNNVKNNKTTPFIHSEWFNTGTSVDFSIAPKNFTFGGSVYRFQVWKNLAGKNVTSPQVVNKPDAFYAVYSGGSGSRSCFIATATYGSELSPEVQFLRAFRDEAVMNTFAGSQFMTAFNAWYYSFSPYVAEFISSHSAIQALARATLYPLVGSLHLAAVAYGALNFNPELGVVAAGLIASSLIGLVYFSPPVTLALSLLMRRWKIILRLSQLKPLGIVWLISVALMLLGETLASPAIVMAATTLFVLATLSLSALCTAVKIVWKLNNEASS
jgi:M6 family metalloprotease-like protein